MVNADFWSRTLQNWQSEFLAVGSMAVFAIYLRQRGSPESKPVGQPHGSTGIEELSHLDAQPSSSVDVCSWWVPGRGAQGSSFAARTTTSRSPRASWVTTGSK